MLKVCLEESKMQRFKLSAIAACLLWACLPAISSCASDTVSTSSSSLRAVPAEPKSQVVRRPSAAAAASIGQWADTTGMYDRALVSSGGSTCQVPQKSIVLKADVSSAPSIYLYEDSGTEVLGSWPGTGMERVPGCDGLWYYQYGLVTKNPFNVIFSSVGSGRYPADQEPGIPFSQSSPCFDYSNLKFRNAAFCGIKVKGASPEVSLYVDGSKVPSGGMVEIPPGSGVDAALVIEGEDQNASGSFSVNGSQGSFRNGDVIRLGARADGGKKGAESEISVSYGGKTSSWKLRKDGTEAQQFTDDPFVWGNALVYFVVTDRFANGDRSNDHSFGRPYRDTHDHATATFHGGDIKGLTEKLDYIKSLGANAIWITPPYEQAHGWIGGGDRGNFAHYAYHGYYGLDWTAMDPNMGTVAEFRKFVTEAHKRGIRVIMDVVMNHSGYATLKDMCDFKFGATSDGWDPCQDWTGSSFHSKPIDESRNPKWDRWWGTDWLLHGGYGDTCGAGDGLDACVSYLPDFKNTDTHGKKVSVPQFLQEKWSKPNPSYDIPASKPWRSGSYSVAEFQAHWLASWVEEFGIDGFRCDTAKHVAQSTWKLLKEYSSEALSKWRSRTSPEQDPAAAWKDGFFMTGENWGMGPDPDDSKGYASAGGFDSMINFAFNPKSACTEPDENDFEQYGGYFGTGSGAPRLNALTYLSSHDTSLCRPDDMRHMAAVLELLPGGVQVYYGDETARENDDGDGVGDFEHGTRSDMNFPSDVGNARSWARNTSSYSGTFSSDPLVAHWQKIGQFRSRNPAVGAGRQTSLMDGSFCRKYSDSAKGIKNSVVIHITPAQTVETGDCFKDGTLVQDGYTGATAIVSGGRVTLPASNGPVLLEVKR